MLISRKWTGSKPVNAYVIENREGLARKPAFGGRRDGPTKWLGSGTVGQLDGYSVVRRLKKYEASGAATARMSADQIKAASTGCCMGHA